MDEVLKWIDGQTKEPEIPFHLKKLGISEEQKHKLSVFPEFIFHEAVHICSRKAKKGFIPERDEFQYFMGIAKKLSENHKYYISKKPRIVQRGDYSDIDKKIKWSKFKWNNVGELWSISLD
jgi:hypothetical protein